MANSILEIKDKDFYQEVIKSEKPVIVDFYTSWCGPCKILMPELEKLSQDYLNKVKIVKINVEKSTQTPTQFGIMGVPNILFFREGKIVDQIASGATTEKIKKVIENKLI